MHSIHGNVEQFLAATREWNEAVDAQAASPGEEADLRVNEAANRVQLALRSYIWEGIRHYNR